MRVVRGRGCFVSHGVPSMGGNISATDWGSGMRRGEFLSRECDRDPSSMGAKGVDDAQGYEHLHCVEHAVELVSV